MKHEINKNQFQSIGFGYYGENTWINRDDSVISLNYDLTYTYEWRDRSDEGEFKYEYFNSYEEVIAWFS